MLLGLFKLATFLVAAQAAVLNYTEIAEGEGYSGTAEYSTSPAFYPTPQGGRLANAEEWDAAYAHARELVSQMNIAEKVNLTTGIGMLQGPCSGNTGSVPRLNISSICVQDGPLGIRGTDFTTVFPSGMAASSTWNKQLIYDRAVAIGQEYSAKGIDAILGPVYGPIGVKAAGGRGWEGHGPDAYLEGAIAYLQTLGIQSQGVISVAKHFIGNEQEHYRFPAGRSFGPVQNVMNNTQTLSAEIDDRSMHELYLWPFAEAVRAGVGSIMCSYQRVNDSQACQNSYMLNYLLKEELGFQGYVMTDWTALYSGVDAAISGLDMDMPGEPEYWGGNLTLAALKGSVPMDRLDDMATRILAPMYYAKVYNKDGPNFDARTRDTYGYEFFAQEEGAYKQLNHHVDVRSDFSRMVALKAAEEAVVLLKNDGEALPLSMQNTKKLAIIGEAAAIDDGGSSCHTYGCYRGASGTGYGSGAGTFTYFITPGDGIGARAQKEGMQYDVIPAAWDVDYAVSVAEESDAAIVVVKNLVGEEIANFDGHIGDLSNNFTLWHNADGLIANVTAVNNNTIVVVTAGQQFDMEKWADHENVTAIIYSSYLGQDYGTALASVLFGDHNPSGRLPFTIAKNPSDYIPVVINATTPKPFDTLYNHSIYVDYKYFDKNDLEVRHEFGYGLSYSNFTLSDINVETIEEFTEEIETKLEDYKTVYEFEEPSMDPRDYYATHDLIEDYTYPYITSDDEIVNETYPYPDGYSTEQLSKPVSKAAGGLGGNPHLWDVGFLVTSKTTNVGPYDGAFVPQLYVAFPDDDEFETPPVQLRGFDKVFLQVGESSTSTFEVTRKDLSVWDTKSQQWKVLRGEYTFYVGSSSRQLDLVASVTLE